MIKILSIILFLISTSQLTAQIDSTLKDFFPSSVGNVWDYDTPNGLVRYEIIKDSVDQNGNKFIFYYLEKPTYRIDTMDNVYFVPYNLNWLKYKLEADSGDTWQVRPEGTSVRRREALVTNKYHTTAFGLPSEILEIEYWNLDYGDTVINEFAIYENTEILAAGFGLLYDYTAHGPVYTIRGCIIEQDTFGIVTSVKEDLKLLNDFKLYQNYPNPFNATTTIKYEKAKTAYVKLKVINILGEEVALLVNEQKPPGTYEVDFNAAGLSSGVYITVLQVNKKRLSRSMLLIK